MVLALAGACLLVAMLLIAAGVGGGGSTAVAVSGGGEPQPQTDASVPARNVTMLGETPEEPGASGGGETWGVGNGSGATVIVRYAQGVGWTRGPALPQGFVTEPSPLTGTMTPGGAGVLAGTVPISGGAKDVLLVRDPGGAFTEAPPVPGEEAPEKLLLSGEALFGGESRAPMIAALDEPGGKAGALVVPVHLGSGVEKQVLHWDGTAWSSEPIAIPAVGAEEFRVLAIAASSPTNAWLLGELSASAYPAGSVALFRRVTEGGKTTWVPVTLVAGKGDGEAHPLTLTSDKGVQRPLAVAGAGSPPTVRGQLLTVSSEGVWVDGERGDIHGRTPDSATLFYKPEGSAGGRVLGSWCVAPPENGEGCERALPRALPSQNDRSFAWAGGGPFGQRVITGLPGSITLRLTDETFENVLALGGGENAEQTAGARFGSAFSSTSEGWLGAASLPVHLSTSPEPSRLTTFSVPFRHPLLAVAPQPGAPVGALGSEALAVGDLGAVARFKPGASGQPGHWVPESLFGPSGRVEKPRLRSVAWPTPGRAFAVGDAGKEIGEQMWLWRGETGLWEHDPAAPLNFTANLLGIAFDPTNPTRGYVVGTKQEGRGGVLLKYGKSWTPEEASLPAEVQQAAFVAITFAGSQAIVAYRLQPNPSVNHFVGGLLLNDGSGWRIDHEAAELIGEGAPIAVAGLPDGGAAFETRSPGIGPRIFERENAGAQWKETATPLPGAAQGSLSLFREGGALRAVVSGGGGVGNQTEAVAAPPGFPPNFLPPLAPVGGGESGGLLRQTASGWRDEGHELDPLGPPPGGYIREDEPYQPDSILATLINPETGAGWVVGGNVNENERVETANVERYTPNPSEGAPASGVETGPLPAAESGWTRLAFGGNAECATPCGERAKAGVGPLTWLSAAANLANRSSAQAFFYTGPSVTEGVVGGIRTLPIPFAEELELTKSVIESQLPPPARWFAAPSPQDLDARPEREGNEAAFAGVFTGQAEPEAERCSPETAGCEQAYFAQEIGGVETIVLDDTGDVGANQLQWLSAKLAAAAGQHKPAIVVGSADVAAQMNAGDGQADRVAEVLTRPSAPASAYFFNAPEEDVKQPLSFGGQTIPSFGSGTLGYVDVANESAGNFHGASGILLGEVDTAEYGKGEAAGTLRAPVRARLVPVIGELALEAKDGVLLRRSQAALFTGLARRPRAGGVQSTNSSEQRLDPYIPIPEICVGSCATAMLPEYSFESSDKHIARFVQHNNAAVDPHAVLENSKSEPLFEEGHATSGLLCALNPGQTEVRITAGGYTASLLVTVQAGSVRQPCGTVPAEHKPSQQSVQPPPPPPTQQSPNSAAPASSPPPIPLPPPPTVAAPPVRHPRRRSCR
jgi:hypothetical protein